MSTQGRERTVRLSSRRAPVALRSPYLGWSDAIRKLCRCVDSRSLRLGNTRGKRRGILGPSSRHAVMLETMVFSCQAACALNAAYYACQLMCRQGRDGPSVLIVATMILQSPEVRPQCFDWAQTHLSAANVLAVVHRKLLEHRACRI